jgi:hypothetical protein
MAASTWVWQSCQLADCTFRRLPCVTKQALGEAAAARVAAADAARQAAATAEAAARLVAWDLRLLQGGLSSGRIAGASAAAVAQTVLSLLTEAGKTIGIPTCQLAAVFHVSCTLTPGSKACYLLC